MSHLSKKKKLSKLLISGWGVKLPRYTILMQLELTSTDKKNIANIFFLVKQSTSNIYIYIYTRNTQWWSCELVHCPARNATDPIWRVLASSVRISSWTPLKTQHSNPNPNPKPFANQLWSIDFLTPRTPPIIPHRLPAFLESLMPHKSCKMLEKQSEALHTFLWHFFQV